MYYGNDHRRQARAYSAAAAATHRRYAAGARYAAELYQHAASIRDSAAWLARHPDLWDEAMRYTPAVLEAAARSLGRCADIYLRSAFHALDERERLLAHAAAYRDMAARQDARLAELSA